MSKKRVACNFCKVFFGHLMALKMKNLTLKIADIARLKSIEATLFKNAPLTSEDQFYLADIISRMPTTEDLLAERIPLDAPIEVTAWDMDKTDSSLEKWRKLFAVPIGWDYTGFCYPVPETDRLMLEKNVIMIAQFAPSMTHNLNHEKRCYEVLLKDNGMAVFELPTLEDVQFYPELYNFKGSWKEAYLLLIETLKKGWPMEEFPEELQQFLKK